MKKIVSLVAALLSFSMLMAAELNYIDYSMSSVSGDDGVASGFTYARIVSSSATSGTTYNTIVFGAGNTVAEVAADNGTFLLTSQQLSAINSATQSNSSFYFEFYNDAAQILGYSDYVSASDLQNSLSSINTATLDFSIGQTLNVTGYAAPEPTSGLLLLVGGALLGLRRKRRVA